jgi:FkbM family methyltransferase
VKDFLKKKAKGLLRRSRFAAEAFLKGPQPLPKRKLTVGRSMQEIMEYFSEVGFRPGTVIDVGFNTGTDGLYGVFADCAYLAVDPLQESEPFLKAQKAKTPRFSYFLAAAGPTEGELEMGVSECFGGSSAFLKDKLPTRKVPMLSLDHMARQIGAQGPYLIKVDVQGAELDVLRGAKQILDETEVLILETRLCPFKGAPEIADVVSFLKKNGFSLFEVFNPLYRPGDGAMGQLDVVAVRTEGFFRTADKYRLGGFRTKEQQKKNTEAKLKSRERRIAALEQSP